ncbi:hypothetical protein CGLO_14407 [Colletotrichum gloeosporioides Cg-14]|uniref:Uncharacterized protein n=1 Tax=Colletotrichum gloeosporioides (strain Cg-14) TaxID=1237896 RepID=T0K1C9_COLGC|nr:hypothetical protein CGLO_14407 [Colletotrichum gloeosporioides Cg-14]
MLNHLKAFMDVDWGNNKA